jgi:putative transposase
MANYRRACIKGGTYFFTVVTYRRQKLFNNPECRIILRDAIKHVRQQHPFQIDAWALLPEHLHCIWTLPEGDADFSKRWGLIKAGFSKQAKPFLHRENWMNASKISHRETTIWQRRFWEHQIRDEEDFSRHVDYIHWNPVKHGHAAQAKDWPYSTFHRYVRDGVYPENWGISNDIDFDVGE